MHSLDELGIVAIPLPTHFPVGDVNVFLVKRDPPLLVDTGLRTDETYEKLTAAFKENGYAISDLGGIIVTHGHRDHVGMLGRLAEESGAPVYAHPLVGRQSAAQLADAEGRRLFYVGIMHEFGVPEEVRDQVNSLYDKFQAMSDFFEVDVSFEDGGETLGYRTVFVPGHSASDTLLIDEANGYTFVGDHILTTSNPNPLIRRAENGGPRPKSLVEYQDSLRKGRALDLGLCLPGHGEPFRDHVAVIDGILARQDKRSQQVLKLVTEGHSTPYAVSRILFPNLPLENIHLGLSIAIGHMEVLETRGELAEARDNGALRYIPV
ncbi:MAG: MBL fold metallo-hydrolase [Candidatus Hydrogenedentota bacterium]